jgi:hypothetical protein
VVAPSPLSAAASVWASAATATSARRRVDLPFRVIGSCSTTAHRDGTAYAGSRSAANARTVSSSAGLAGTPGRPAAGGPPPRNRWPRRRPPRALAQHASRRQLDPEAPDLTCWSRRPRKHTAPGRPSAPDHRSVEDTAYRH